MESGSLNSADQVRFCREAVEAAKWAGDEIAILNVINRDFDHLTRFAEWQRWTDDTPVSPEVFGPLWPEGSPPGWPADPDLPKREDLSPVFLALNSKRVVDEVVNLFNAMNRFYYLRTGERLTLDGDIFTRVAQLVGVGV